MLNVDCIISKIIQENSVLDIFRTKSNVIESPLKMMKNAFYFILQALFVLKIFKFLVMNFW